MWKTRAGVGTVIISACSTIVGTVAPETGWLSIEWARVLTVIGCIGIAFGLFLIIPIERIKHLRFRMPFFFKKDVVEQTKPQPILLNWLEQVLISDREHLDERIVLIPPVGWNYYFISEPYMEALITVINNAVFPILIESSIGSFKLNYDVICNQTATIEHEQRLLRIQRATLRIRQGITKETVELIQSLRAGGKELLIDISDFFLIVQSEEPNYQSEPIKVRIGTQFTDNRIKVIKK